MTDRTNSAPIRFAESSGPRVHWGAAQVGIANALTLNGIANEVVQVEDIGDPMDVMARMSQQELAIESGAADKTPFDEGGMLYVDSGLADLVVKFRQQLVWATRGIGCHTIYAHKNLRGLARLYQPQYVAIAVRKELGITSLDQIAKEKPKLRLATVSRNRVQTRTMGYTITRIFEESGFTQADIEMWGGKVIAGEHAYQAIVDEDVDMIALPAYAFWGPPWGSCWVQAQVRIDLQFLPIRNQVLDQLVDELDLRKGFMPAYLFRGLEEPVPTIVASEHVVATHSGLSDEDAYAIVEALDDHPECLQELNAVFSFFPRLAGRELGIPIHPGAKQYYEERGYL